jgi:hypothetical protein
MDTRDVAAGVVTAIELDLYAEPIALAGHNTTVEALFALVCDTAGVARPLWKSAAPLWVLPSLWTELAFAAVNRAAPIPSLVPMLLCEQEWRDPDATQQQLGISVRPLLETVQDTIGWYRKVGYC